MHGRHRCTLACIFAEPAPADLRYAEVEEAFRTSVDDYLAFRAERGEPPDRPYSGKIPLRVDPELHRRAAAQAQAVGMSLNQWVKMRLEQLLAPPRRSS